MMPDQDERTRALLDLCLGLPPEELQADIGLLMHLLGLRLETPTTLFTLELHLRERPKTAEERADDRPPLKLVKG